MADVKPFNPQDWIGALRSGDYAQGRCGLHTQVRGEDTYCCLGVLCDLAMKAGVDVKPVPHPYADGNVQVKYDGSGGYPPDSVIEWAGLVNYNPVVRGNNSLSYLNDSGCSFNEIAYIIKADQESVFVNAD